MSNALIISLQFLISLVKRCFKLLLVALLWLARYSVALLATLATSVFQNTTAKRFITAYIKFSLILMLFLSPIALIGLILSPTAKKEFIPICLLGVVCLIFWIYHYSNERKFRLIEKKHFERDLKNALYPTNEEFVYLMRRSDGAIKIGHSKNPVARLNQLKTADISMELLEAYPVKEASKLERFLHNQHSNRNVGGEWFAFSDSELDRVKRQLEKSIQL